MSIFSQKNLNILAQKRLPDTPGVYFFLDENKKVLYIGKATSLRSRVRSYASRDIAATRGPKIVRMLEQLSDVKWRTTDSVLEALLLESYLIKKHQPPYNTAEKDDKSYNYVVITREKFPRVLLARERDLYQPSLTKERVKANEDDFVTRRQPGAPASSREAFSLFRNSEKTVPEKSSSVTKSSLFASYLNSDCKYMYVFGPFPQGGALREALKIVRRIFPYRDKCVPFSGKPCFNSQIGLCPGVCVGKLESREYAKTIRHIKMFFEGKKKMLVKKLEKEMKEAAQRLEFEKANELKKTLFALGHIRDVALLKVDRKPGGTGFRIEAYDAAHLAGKDVVGVMTVVENGVANKSEYRQFKIRTGSANDLANLEEILTRRFNHPEWRFPDLIAVDGFDLQIRVAEKVLQRRGISIPVVGVVKDERHKPKDILGFSESVRQHRDGILLANSEAHRFAIAFHRKRRTKNFQRSAFTT